MSIGLGLTVDQLVTEERVGKSAPHANVESPQALVTNLSNTESSIPVLSPVAGHTCKISNDSECNPKNNNSIQGRNRLIIYIYIYIYCVYVLCYIFVMYFYILVILLLLKFLLQAIMMWKTHLYPLAVG